MLTKWCYGPWLLVMGLLCVVIHSFNLDTNSPIVFSHDPDNYFGYSVALLSNSMGQWVLVGAPRANLSDRPRIKEQGAVFSCKIEDQQCTVVPFDSETTNEKFVFGTDSYLEHKEKSWLGVSLDTTRQGDGGGRVLTCAHLWKNNYYTNEYLVNGACYVINNELDGASADKLIPLVSAEKQVINNGDYFYYAGQAGISAQFVKNSNTFLLGAPGIDEWKGSIAVYSLSSGGSITKRSVRMGSYGRASIPESPKSINVGAYLGYAVTSGVFDSTGKVFNVLSAPREGYRGKVIIADVDEFRAMIERVTLVGEQMGEYYGTAIAAVDVNGDGLDDVLVGAPMHTETTSGEGDEGAVYIYMNEGQMQFKKVSPLLMGDQKPGSRFGSSISLLGDLNMDGYDDVAVGAPYEDGVGAVYIYLGSKNGLIHGKPQKILPPKNTPAKGFGISVSKGYDIDDNNYPDIAVGAYDSSHAFLYRAHQVVNLHGTIELNQQKIDIEQKHCDLNGQPTTCITAEVCLKYHGKFVQSNLSVDMSLEVDTITMKNNNFTRVGFDNKKTSKIFRNLNLVKNERNCQRYDIYALEEPRDIFTPVLITARYNMTPFSNDGFCKTCPVVENPEEDFYSVQIGFKKICGSEICDADLTLNAWVKGHEDLNVPVIIGSEIILNADVTNNVEAAYNSHVIITIPTWLQISQKPFNCDEFGLKKDTLICSLKSPLKAKESELVQLKMNVRNAPITEQSLVLKVSARTDSRENSSKLSDNDASIILPLRYYPDMTVKGILESEQILYERKNQTNVVFFNHTYQLFNTQISPVPTVSFTLRVPTSSLDNETTFMEIYSINPQVSKSMNASISCDFVNRPFIIPGETDSKNIWKDEVATNSTSIPDIPTLGPRRRKRDTEDLYINYSETKTNFSTNSPTEESEVKEVYNLDCNTALCTEIVCHFGPFENEVTVTVPVTIALHLDKIFKAMGKKDTALISTEGRVEIPNLPNYTIPNVSPDSAVLTSFLIPKTPAPSQVPWWAILVGVLCGLLLLLIIIVALIKSGFFQRGKKEELKRLLHEAEVQPNQPLVNGSD